MSCQFNPLEVLFTKSVYVYYVLRYLIMLFIIVCIFDRRIECKISIVWFVDLKCIRQKRFGQ